MRSDLVSNFSLVGRMPADSAAISKQGAHTGHTGVRRRKHIALSETSNEPWVPPSAWLADPPYLLLDVLYAFLSALFVIGYGLFVSTLLAPFFGTPTAMYVLALPLDLSRIPLAIQWCAVAVGAGVFAFNRLVLEPVTYNEMIKAESLILDSIEGDVKHHWNAFKTRHARWHIHSLLMRSDKQTSNPPGWEKPAIVFLHGHSAGAAHWEAVFDSLSEMADLYVLDLPGWGRSPLPAELAAEKNVQKIVDLQCEMLAGWLVTNKLKRITLVGHSFGGYYAIQFSKRHPKIVEQLILVAPAGLTPVMPEGSLAWGGLFKFSPPQWVARNFGRLGYLVFKTLYTMFTTEDLRFPAFYYQLAAQTASTGYGDQIAAKFLRFGLNGGLWWSQPCLSDVLALDLPLSVIWGQRDDMLPSIIGAILHRIRPHTDLYIIKDALHNPAHNNPRAFCEAIADCVLKYRCAPRVTLGGRGLGQAYEDGTADLLLEPMTHPTHKLSVSGVLEVPPSVEIERCVSHSSHRSARPHQSDILSSSKDGMSDSEPSDALSHASEGTEISDDEEEEEDGLAPQTPTNRPALHDDDHEDAEHPSGFRPGAISPVSAYSSFSRESATSEQLLRSLPPTATPNTAARLSRATRAGADLATGLPTSPSHRPHFRAPDLSPVLEGTASEAPASPCLLSTASPAVDPSPHPDWSGHDGIVGEFGKGRGYCHACFRRVTLYKSYWRCACAAWSFNAHIYDSKTREHFHSLVAFLDELYVYGTFNARTSKTVIMFLRVKTPLPSAAVPTPVLEALRLDAHPAEAPAPAPPPPSTPEGAAAAAGSGKVKRDGSGSCGIIFAPAPATFPRGEAFLLD